ncbi:YciI family protein [Lentzea sp. NPDC034063]|uniref:YciI family protein n=1 Tax=unclassified Lentzea TaxID=2643253 RepID=UPI0033FA8C11
MEFLCYHRDRPGSMPLRSALIEEHWSYMDGFELIARGPTFADGVLTGSVHVVDVPDAAAARAFAFDEPVYQAGGYRDVLVRRWRNVLGRTMWDSPRGSGHLVLGFGSGEAADLVPARPEELIAYGPLLSDDGTAWLGTAALVRSADPASVLTADRYDAVEVHEWEPGGRR